MYLTIFVSELGPQRLIRNGTTFCVFLLTVECSVLEEVLLVFQCITILPPPVTSNTEQLLVSNPDAQQTLDIKAYYLVMPWVEIPGLSGVLYFTFPFIN